MFGQVGWSGAGEHSGFDQASRDERGCLRLAETHRGIEAIGNEIAEPIAPDDLQRQLGMVGQKFADARGKNEAGEKGVDIDPKPAAHRHGRASCLDGGAA
jgi:hypothetical protein